MMRTAVFSTALIGGLLRRFDAVLFGIGASNEHHQGSVGSALAGETAPVLRRFLIEILLL
jgi:hypothetical protein